MRVVVHTTGRVCSNKWQMDLRISSKHKICWRLARTSDIKLRRVSIRSLKGLTARGPRTLARDVPGTNWIGK